MFGVNGMKKLIDQGYFDINYPINDEEMNDFLKADDNDIREMELTELYDKFIDIITFS